MTVLRCSTHLLQCSESTRQVLHRTHTLLPLRRGYSDVKGGPKSNLYQLLFPDEQARQAERESQRRRLDEHNAKVRAAISTEPVQELEDAVRRKKKQIGRAKRVLILKGASKNLNREDFLRIIPQGKNLEGWVSGKTYIEKIVQDRDLETLDRTGTYYLIFKTAAATAEYQKRAIRISKLLNFHGPPSMINERQPPPGLVLPGEDMKTLIRSFHLAQYKSQLRLYQPENELPAEVAAIAECGGLPQIVRRPGRMPVEVAIRLPQSPITRPELQEAIRRSEIQRNLPWTGSEYEGVKLEEWTAPSQPRDNAQSAAGDLAATNEPDNGRRSTFIAGFQTQAEAEAFVRHWHRRTIPNFRRGRPTAPLLVEADVL